MSIRPPKAAAAARNLTRPVVPMFVGDPAGEAITQGVYAGVTPGLAGRAGFVYLGEEGSAERSFNGYARTPQPALQARTYLVPIGTNAVFANGPNDASNIPSTDAGQPYLDARYRALAQRMMRSG